MVVVNEREKVLFLIILKSGILSYNSDSLCGDDVPDTSLMLSSHQVRRNFTNMLL